MIMIGLEAILGRLREKRAHMREQHVLMMLMIVVVVSIVVTRSIIAIIVVVVVVASVIVFVGRRDWRVQETYSMRSGAAVMLVFFHTQMNNIKI